MRIHHLLFQAAAILLANNADGAVRLPSVLSEHMVLQRDQPLPVWGWAEAGEEVRVQFDSQEAVAAKAGPDGRWKVTLPAQPAGGPHQLVVKGSNELTLRDVLVGEVWVCSGQSNMEWTVSATLDAPQEIAAAKFSAIRHLAMPKIPAGQPVEDRDARWEVCAPEVVPHFTAVGYFFARHLHEQLKVPIGLLHTSWGGTLIEPWTPAEAFSRVPSLAGIAQSLSQYDPKSEAYQKALSGYVETVQQWSAYARAALAQGRGAPPLAPVPAPLQRTGDMPGAHGQPATLFNGMVAPLVPFAIRGAIWYQGESNHGEGLLYTDKMRALIDGWRSVWGQGNFPFYYVQIAPYHYGEEEPTILPRCWEAQTKALEIPNTGMAVIHDVGNTRDIHPQNKQEVGRRLALIALARDYGHKDLVFSGPSFKSMSVEGGKIRVKFDHVGGGLKSRDDQPLSWFEVLGETTGFRKASAVIDGDSIVVSAPEVPNPVSVRFAWHKLAEPNLINAAGLPAVPFRSGERPYADSLKANVPDSAQYQLVYDLDLAKLAPNPAYSADRHAEVAKPFSRVAYYLELQPEDQPLQYVWVSMASFCEDPAKLGVPTASGGASFQMAVKDLHVVTNVADLKAGEHLSGWIEFWPNNYGPENGARVTGGSDVLYDFGDLIAGPAEAGYGSMQIHRPDAGQTIFALNHWIAGEGADLGIGNSAGKTRDWTFAENARRYTHKRLRVFVRP